MATPKRKTAEASRRQALGSRRNLTAVKDAEDLADARALERANAEFERSGRKSIPVSEAKRRLGLK